MMRTMLRSTFGVLALFALGACGETSGSVLERIPEHPANGSGGSGTNKPPGSRLRVDAFIVGDAWSCAIGNPCRTNNDPDMRCFEFEDENGNGFAFRRDTLSFVEPTNQEAIDAAEQSHCFHLIMSDEEKNRLHGDFNELVDRVFDLSDGEILLDVYYHDITQLSAAFVRFENEWSIFLPTRALDDYVPKASRDTDFTYAITGSRDPMSGLTPQVEHCAGTDRNLDDGLAGAGYTWLTTECDGGDTLLRHWMFQVTVALRDVNDFNDAFDRDYPPCRETLENPANWWPNPDECSVDPDAPTCGENRCEGTDNNYAGHVLTAHWPRGRAFVGNHCQNGRLDERLGENQIDAGGVCDLLGQ
jgi:hypothetical protein